MGVTAQALYDALTAKLRSNRRSVDATRALDIAPLFGESTKSVIQIKTEIHKGVDDKVAFGLRMQLSGNGFTSSGHQVVTYAPSPSLWLL